MAVLQVLHIPNPLLKKVSEPVTQVDDALRRTLDDMLETMYAERGIGLAAPQVGIFKRMIVIHLVYGAGGERSDPPMYLINPEILETSDDTDVDEEGCLSVPEEREEVVRPCRIRVKFLDRDGKEQVIGADGLLARCIQHEIDHLNGILFIDRVSRLKRDVILRRAKKRERLEKEEAADE